MAKQIGIFKIEGTLGGLTFYEQNGQHYVRQKSSLSKDQIKHDPNFERTRENNTEFGEASKLTKAMMKALQPNVIKGDYWFPKLNAVSYKSVRKDASNIRGQRKLETGNEFDYYGYDVGGNSDIFEGTLNLTYDRPSGNIDFEVLPFVPFSDIFNPSGATHFDFTFGVGEIDLSTKEIISKASGTSAKIDATQSSATASIVQNLSVNAGSAGFVVGVFTIRFFQWVSGVYYRLYQGDSSGIVLSSVAP